MLFWTLGYSLIYHSDFLMHGNSGQSSGTPTPNVPLLTSIVFSNFLNVIIFYSIWKCIYVISLSTM